MLTPIRSSAFFQAPSAIGTVEIQGVDHAAAVKLKRQQNFHVWMTCTMCKAAAKGSHYALKTKTVDGTSGRDDRFSARRQLTKKGCWLNRQRSKIGSSVLICTAKSRLVHKRSPHNVLSYRGTGGMERSCCAFHTAHPHASVAFFSQIFLFELHTRDGRSDCV